MSLINGTCPCGAPAYVGFDHRVECANPGCTHHSKEVENEFKEDMIGNLIRELEGGRPTWDDTLPMIILPDDKED